MSSQNRSAAAVRWITIDAERSGQRLDNFLLATLKGVPRTHIYRIVRKGEIRINKGRRKADYRLREGDVLRIPPLAVRAPPPEPPGLAWLETRVLFEDEHLLVLNKPSGMAVHGGSSLSFGVIEALRGLRPAARALELVHRLDRSTSGCLLLAKRRSALRALQESLRAGRFEKTYTALVEGRWPTGLARVAAPLRRTEGSERRVVVHAGGKASLTEFAVTARFPEATLVEAHLVTGRTHQIRVHAAHSGHPVVGDDRYGDAARNALWRTRGVARLFLHAHHLTFPHPATEAVVDIIAPLPPDLAAVLESLHDAKV